jgi:hypothetical protein
VEKPGWQYADRERGAGKVDVRLFGSDEVTVN